MLKLFSKIKNPPKIHLNLPINISNLTQTLHYAFHTSFFTSQIFGYLPLSISRKSSVPKIVAVLLSIFGIIFGLCTVFIFKVRLENHTSGTFQYVSALHTTFVLVMPTLSRLTLLCRVEKLTNLFYSCIAMLQNLRKIIPVENDLVQLSEKLRKRYRKLTLFYVIVAITICALMFPNLWQIPVQGVTSRTVIADFFLVLTNVMIFMALFSLLGLEFFCQIYNFCLDCLIKSLETSCQFQKFENFQNSYFLEEILNSFDLLKHNVEECSATFEDKMNLDVFYFVMFCIFRGYFASQFWAECCTLASIEFFVSHILIIFISGSGIWSIASLSTRLRKKSGNFLDNVIKFSCGRSHLEENVKFKVYIINNYVCIIWFLLEIPIFKWFNV